MTKHTFLKSGLLAVVLGGLALANPAVNIDARRHPNLAAAQQLSSQAFDRLTSAQQANEWDLAGHAARAKQLLVQANDEMKAAAVASNQRSP